MRNGDKFLKLLSELGYTLFEPDQQTDPNLVLAKMVKSHDSRVVEGFPVVLANLLSQDQSGLNFKKMQTRLRSEKDRKLLDDLMNRSLELLELYGLNDLRQKLVQLLSKKRLVRHPMKKEATSKDRSSLNSERLKKTFLNYFVLDRNRKVEDEQARLQEDLRQEYFLSFVLSPKQKDLLKKKLRGEPMTKTEKEYFSRVVRKKLTALADPDVHRLAQKALQ
jgi:hypothetical protein